MTENIKLINELIDKGGNCVNLSRSIKAKYPELFQYILDNTKFLDDKPNLKINERIYCIANKITSRVRNNFGEYAIFTDIFHGYSMREHTHSKYLSGVKTKQEKENKRIAKESIPKLSERDQKIQKAIIRQKQRRPQLYEDDAVEIQDYVECPISGIRFSMLNEKHITGTLGMSVDEFDSLYPNLIKVSNNHKQKVKEVLQTIDENTGKTIHQTAIEKAQKTLHSVDEHGISGYKKLGQKTRATHMTNIDEHGRNGYSVLASKAIIKGNKTKADKGLIFDTSTKPLFHRYKVIVLHLTEKHRKKLTAGYKTGLAGEVDVWHIDHCYSIKEGFKNKISPLIIAHENNLKMIPWEENLEKSASSSISLEELFSVTGYTENESLLEFENIMAIAIEQHENNIMPSGANVYNIFLEKYR